MWWIKIFSISMHHLLCIVLGYVCLAYQLSCVPVFFFYFHVIRVRLSLVNWRQPTYVLTYSVSGGRRNRFFWSFQSIFVGWTGEKIASRFRWNFAQGLGVWLDFGGSRISCGLCIIIHDTLPLGIRSIAFVRWRMHSRPTFEISDRFQLQAVIIKLAKHYGRHAWIADIHRCSAWMTQLITGRPQLTTKRFGPVSSNYVHLADCNRLKASDLFSWFAYNDVALT